MADLILLFLQHLSAIIVLLHQAISLICTGPVLILMTTVAIVYLKIKFSKPTNCQNCKEDFDVNPFNFDQESEVTNMETLESSDEEIDDTDSGFAGSTQGEISLEQGSKILLGELNKTKEIQRYLLNQFFNRYF